MWKSSSAVRISAHARVCMCVERRGERMCAAWACNRHACNRLHPYGKPSMHAVRMLRTHAFPPAGSPNSWPILWVSRYAAAFSRGSMVLGARLRGGR